MDGFGITASGGDERSDHQSMRRFVDLLGLGTDEIGRRRRFYSMGPQARLIPDSCLRGGRMRGDGVSYSSLFVRAFVAKADHA